MQNKENIIDFLLGFNKHAKVIEPEWLKEELKAFGEKLIELYK